MVMKNMLLATEAGLGNGETPIFPMQIFRVKEGVNYNPGDPNYDLFKLAMPLLARSACSPTSPSWTRRSTCSTTSRATRRRRSPTWAAAPASSATSTTPTGRSANGRGNLSLHVHQPAAPGHQSQGRRRPVLRAAGPRSWRSCVEQLDWSASRSSARKKRAQLPRSSWARACGSTPRSWTADDEVREVLKHGTLSVGFIGLAETLKALVGAAPWRERRASQNLGLRSSATCAAAHGRACQPKRGLNFTPASPRPPRACPAASSRMDRARYGVHPGRHRPRLLHQQLPRAGVLPHHRLRQDPDRGALPRADQRRPHLLRGAGRRPHARTWRPSRRSSAA